MSFIVHDQKIDLPDIFLQDLVDDHNHIVAWFDSLHHSKCDQTKFKILIKGTLRDSVVAHWSFSRPADDGKIIDLSDPHVENFIKNSYKKVFMENLLWFIRPHFLILNPPVAINVAARFAASILSGISIHQSNDITKFLNYYPGITRYLQQVYEVSWSVRTGHYVEYATNFAGRYLVQRIQGAILELANGMRNRFADNLDTVFNLHYSERTLQHWGVDIELNDPDRTKDNFSHSIGRHSRKNTDQNFFGLERAHFECPDCRVQLDRPVDVNNHMVAEKCGNRPCCGDMHTSYRNRRAHKVAFCRERYHDGGCNFCLNPSIHCHCVKHTSFIMNYAAGLVRDNLSNGNMIFTQDHLAVALNMLEVVRMPDLDELRKLPQFELSDRYTFDPAVLNEDPFHWNWPVPKISDGEIHINGNANLHWKIPAAMNLLPVRLQDRHYYTEAISQLVGYAGGPCVRKDCIKKGTYKHDIKFHPICNICSREKKVLPNKYSVTLLVKHLYGHFFYENGEKVPITDGSLVCPLCCYPFPEVYPSIGKLTWGNIFDHILGHHVSLERGWHVKVPCDKECEYFDRYVSCDNNYNTYMDYLVHQFMCHVNTSTRLCELLNEIKIAVQRTLFGDTLRSYSNEEHAEAFRLYLEQLDGTHDSDEDHSSDESTVVPSDGSTVVPSDNGSPGRIGESPFSGESANTSLVDMELDNITTVTPSVYAGGGIMAAALPPTADEHTPAEEESTTYSADFPHPTAPAAEEQGQFVQAEKTTPPTPVTAPFVGASGILQRVHRGVTNTTASIELENEFNLQQAQRNSLAQPGPSPGQDLENNGVNLDAMQDIAPSAPQPGLNMLSRASDRDQPSRIGQRTVGAQNVLEMEQREYAEEQEMLERQREALLRAAADRRYRHTLAVDPTISQAHRPDVRQPIGVPGTTTVTTVTGLAAGANQYNAHRRNELASVPLSKKSSLKTQSAVRHGTKNTRFAQPEEEWIDQNRPDDSSHYRQETNSRPAPPTVRQPPPFIISTPTSSDQSNPHPSFHQGIDQYSSMSPIKETTEPRDGSDHHPEDSEEYNTGSEGDSDYQPSGQDTGRHRRDGVFNRDAWPNYQSSLQHREQGGGSGSRRRRDDGSDGNGNPGESSSRLPPPPDTAVWCEHPRCTNIPPFANQLQLDHHVRTRHKCTEKNCLFSSMSLDAMAIHHLERHGSKTEYCSVCKVEVPDLATHNLSHSLCPICDEPFSNRLAVKQHVVTCRNPVDASQEKAPAPVSGNFTLNESFAVPPSIVGRHRQSSLLSAVIALTEKVGLNEGDKVEIQSRIKEHVAQEEVARERAKYGSFNIYQADPLLLLIPTFGDVNRYPKDENLRILDRSDVFKAFIPTTPGEKINQFNNLERVNLKVAQLTEKFNLTEKVSTQILCDWLDVDVRDYLTSHTHAESTSQLTYKQILTVLQRDFTAIKIDEFEKYVHTAVIMENEKYLRFCSKVHRWLRTISLTKNLEQRETYIEKHRRALYIANLPKVIKIKLREEEDRLCVEYTASEIRVYFITYTQRNGDVPPELERTFRPRDFGIRRVEVGDRKPHQPSRKDPRVDEVSTSFQEWENIDHPSRPPINEYDRPDNGGRGRRVNRARGVPAEPKLQQSARQVAPQPESEDEAGPRYHSPILVSGPKRNKNKKTSGKRPASEKDWVAPQFTTPGIGKAISPSGKRTRAKREDEMNIREDLRSNRDNRNQKPKVTHSSLFPVSEDQPQKYREPRDGRQRHQYEINAENTPRNSQPGRAPSNPPTNQSIQAPMKGILKHGSDGKERRWDQSKDDFSRNSAPSRGGFDRQRDSRPQGFGGGFRQGDRQRQQPDSPRPQTGSFRTPGPARASAESVRKWELLTGLGFNRPDKGVACFSCLETGHTTLNCTLYRYEERPTAPVTEPHTYKQNGRLMACGFHRPQDCLRQEVKRSEAKTNRLRRRN